MKIVLSTLAGLVLSVSSVSSQAFVSPLSFDVYLDDKRIGSHQVNISEANNQTRVNVKANFDVKFLFINAYRYRHTANEVWQNGCISQLNTTTDDNGEQLKVQGVTSDKGLKVNTADDSKQLAGCIRTFAYWNPSLLRSAKLLNTQTGDYEAASLSQADTKPMQFKDKAIGQQRYVLKVQGKDDIQLWYDKNNTWQGLQTTISGNKTLRYVRAGE